MKFERILNIVAVLGVIASLLFVGLELRQNQVIAVAGQQQARTEARLNQILSTYEFNQDEIGVENTPWEDQSEIQRYIREQRQVYYWVVNENNFYQYQAGLLSEELWEREARHTATQWNHCHLRHVFEGLEIMKSFETYVRNLTNNCGDSADGNTGIIPRFQ